VRLLFWQLAEGWRHRFAILNLWSLMTPWRCDTQTHKIRHLLSLSRISGLIHAHQTNSLGYDARLRPPRGRIYGGWLRQKARHRIFRSFVIASTCIALLIVERGEERRVGNKWRRACDCVLVLVARWWNCRDWIVFLWVRVVLDCNALLSANADWSFSFENPFPCAWYNHWVLSLKLYDGSRVLFCVEGLGVCVGSFFCNTLQRPDST
jgi:hypothetical protein